MEVNQDLSKIKYILVSPAYGRYYPSIARAKADWLSGADFQIEVTKPMTQTGRYINQADLLKYARQASVILTFPWTVLEGEDKTLEEFFKEKREER